MCCRCVRWPQPGWPARGPWCWLRMMCAESYPHRPHSLYAANNYTSREMSCILRQVWMCDGPDNVTHIVNESPSVRLSNDYAFWCHLHKLCLLMMNSLCMFVSFLTDWLCKSICVFLVSVCLYVSLSICVSVRLRTLHMPSSLPLMSMFDVSSANATALTSSSCAST